MATIFIRPRREEGAERGGSDAFPCFLSRYGRGKRRGPQIFPLTTRGGRHSLPLSLSLASPHLQMTLLAFIVQFEEKGRLLVLIRTPL